MLLLLTSSGDGTSDLIARKLGKEVFRLNYDQVLSYKGFQTEDGWELINPAGLVISSENATRVMHWKAFIDSGQLYDKLIANELKYFFREIYSWFYENGKVKGNSIDYHNRYGKIQILNKASKYFSIPKSLFTIGLLNEEYILKNNRITKSLSSSLTSDGKMLFTTDVSSNGLDPAFPWFLQERIDSNADVTCFVVGDKCFTFERDRSNLSGLDWRAEQSFNIDIEEWRFVETIDADIKRIHRLNQDLQISWGRYDFMRDTHGELVFLEFNANGQWVFLDYHDKYGLLDAVIDYLKN